ncbi:hypothetical protein [Mycobacterium sp. pW045]|uniref:hypothetical protein n=1 Tax=Mycobacterium sp. pW045 TaxID=3238984 RepID=UPI00351B62DC
MVEKQINEPCGQQERITLTRDGGAEAVLLAVDDLEGMAMTLGILGDGDAVVRIAESLAAAGARRARC